MARLLPRSGRASYYVKPKDKKGPSGQAWMAFAGVTTAITGLGVCILGAPEDNISGLDAEEDPYSSRNIVSAYLLRARDRILEYKKSFADPSSEKLLPDFLPPPYQRSYTLLIEINDLLMHSSYDRTRGWTYQKRPDVDTLLSQLFELYEIVVFTSENAMSAAPLVQGLDPNQFITYHLFRDSTKYIDGHHIKDLTNLNRPLTKVIVLDTDPKSVKFHPQNSIILSKWSGDTADTALQDLAPLLLTIAANEVDDVRPVLDFYKSAGEDKVLETFKQRQAMLRLEEEKARSESRKRRGSQGGTAIPTFSWGAHSRSPPPPPTEVASQTLTTPAEAEQTHSSSSSSSSWSIGSWLGWK